ncbi:MAG: TRAP transporter substrate-binding protein [Hyphomicrobiales bacterium]|nr:TRAP transporter substrate-binding protein [Hyphomicrobiales bacterium]
MKFSNKRNYLTSVAAAGFMALAFSASPANAGEKWDMPAAYSAKNFITSSYIAFAEKVTKESGGDLEIVVHPSGSLYKGAEILRAVRSGQVPIGGRYMGAHAKEDAIFGVDTVPFLATNADEAWKLYQASKPQLEAALEKRGMKLLFTAVWPPQGLFAKKEINTVADMKDVKFRAYDAGTTRLATLMGAVPTKTEATEIGQAFSTGVAESMIASGAIGVFRKMWDYVDHFYEVNAWLPKSAVIVNLEAWDKLDDKTKKIVTDAAAETEKSVWAAMAPTNDGYKKTMADNGIKVLEPSAELKAGFRKIGETMSNEWADKAGADAKKVIEAYKM